MSLPGGTLQVQWYDLRGLVRNSRGASLELHRFSFCVTGDDSCTVIQTTETAPGPCRARDKLSWKGYCFPRRQAHNCQLSIWYSSSLVGGSTSGLQNSRGPLSCEESAAIPSVEYVFSLMGLLSRCEQDGVSFSLVIWSLSPQLACNRTPVSIGQSASIPVATSLAGENSNGQVDPRINQYKLSTSAVPVDRHKQRREKATILQIEATDGDLNKPKRPCSCTPRARARTLQLWDVPSIGNLMRLRPDTRSVALCCGTD